MKIICRTIIIRIMWYLYFDTILIIYAHDISWPGERLEWPGDHRAWGAHCAEICLRWGCARWYRTQKPWTLWDIYSENIWEHIRRTIMTWTNMWKNHIGTTIITWTNIRDNIGKIVVKCQNIWDNIGN